MRLIQLHGPEGRRVGIVEGDSIRLLNEARSVYALTRSAVSAGTLLTKAAAADAGNELASYDEIYRGTSRWRILPCIDHPLEVARCMVSGTGLSHMRSADNRQAMHAAGEQVTDSMRMYQWGVEGGRPEPGHVGVSPEWFYKGTGAILRAHGEPLDIPLYAEDGGEEPEIAGIYLIDQAGVPRRIGMAAGNEFSDHVFEKKNYLYLASSKLRTCSIGPELVIAPEFELVRGEVVIERGGAVIWQKAIQSGERAMCHSLANMEHHHFKFEGHRRPGDVHIHFFGADAFSFGEGIRLEDGDIMQVQWDGFGRPLRNPVRVAAGSETPIVVKDV
jgi:hypothetical protein